MKAVKPGIFDPHLPLKPLLGASIVVTRPTDTAAALKRAVRELGGTVLSLPAIVLAASDDAKRTGQDLRVARNCDAVLFLSPAAVRFAYAACPPLRFRGKTRLLAVGESTARAVKRHTGGEVIWPRHRQDSEGLLELPSLADVRGQQVAIIGAPGGRELLTQVLKSRGAKIRPIHVYQRKAPRYTRRHLEPLEQADPPLITLLTSAEALRNLGEHLPLHLFARLAGGDLVVSSARLAMLARERLFLQIHVAASAKPRDLMTAACAAMTRHRL